MLDDLVTGREIMFRNLAVLRQDLSYFIIKLALVDGIGILCLGVVNQFSQSLEVGLSNEMLLYEDTVLTPSPIR